MERVNDDAKKGNTIARIIFGSCQLYREIRGIVIDREYLSGLMGRVNREAAEVVLDNWIATRKRVTARIDIYDQPKYSRAIRGVGEQPVNLLSVNNILHLVSIERSHDEAYWHVLDLSQREHRLPGGGQSSVDIIWGQLAEIMGEELNMKITGKLKGYLK